MVDPLLAGPLVISQQTPSPESQRSNADGTSRSSLESRQCGLDMYLSHLTLVKMAAVSLSMN